MDKGEIWNEFSCLRCIENTYLINHSPVSELDVTKEEIISTYSSKEKAESVIKERKGKVRTVSITQSFVIEELQNFLCSFIEQHQKQKAVIYSQFCENFYFGVSFD